MRPRYLKYRLTNVSPTNNITWIVLIYNNSLVIYMYDDIIDICARVFLKAFNVNFSKDKLNDTK